MKILAFGASSSRTSINKQLAGYAAAMVANASVDLVDLNDYDMPLFSEDKEAEIGKHPMAIAFMEKIKAADAIVISFAEHNSSFTAAYKNLLDWCSRVDAKVFQNKAMIFLSTSPGERGGANVMQAALNTAERFNGHVKAHFSLPSFHQNFDSESVEITDADLRAKLAETMAALSR